MRTRFISPHSFRHSSRFPRLTHFLSVSHVTRYLVPTRRDTAHSLSSFTSHAVSRLSSSLSVSFLVTHSSSLSLHSLRSLRSGTERVSDVRNDERSERAKGTGKEGEGKDGERAACRCFIRRSVRLAHSRLFHVAACVSLTMSVPSCTPFVPSVPRFVGSLHSPPPSFLGAEGVVRE